ncbi:MAG: hypothetical protein AABW63_03475 [Nanoarchaeota archaeon]
MKAKLKIMPGNKKGWIQVVEAFVAILLITGVLLVVLNKRYIQDEDPSTKIYETESGILKSIQIDDVSRSYVLNQSSLPVNWSDIPSGIKNKIQLQKPSYLDCQARICEINNECLGQLTSDKSIYAKSTFISAESSLYSPRQLKIFCWEK